MRKPKRPLLVTTQRRPLALYLSTVAQTSLLFLKGLAVTPSLGVSPQMQSHLLPRLVNV